MVSGQLLIWFMMQLVGLFSVVVLSELSLRLLNS